MTSNRPTDEADLVRQLEALSRELPGYVIRLQGRQDDAFFELLIFKGFSSSTTHPTAFDPDTSVLLPGTSFDQAELLQGPLMRAAARIVRGPESPQSLLDYLSQTGDSPGNN